VSRSLPIFPSGGPADGVSISSQIDHCWNEIGVSGDRSCPLLTTVIHCRNCPVFSAAGRRLLDGAPPPGYHEEWARRLAADADAARRSDRSVLVFRMGIEWMGLETRYFVETTGPRTVRRVPHGRSAVLTGLVNIRGRLELCVSLEGVLHIEREGAAPLSPTSAARLLVVEHDKKAWVFPADEVHGVRHFSARDLLTAPATVARSPNPHIKGLFQWGDHKVGYLDAEKLFATLEAAIA
jgi:chemotaxis-related protein WspD